MSNVIRIEGLSELLDKMPGLLPKPLRRFLERATIKGQSESRQLAPVDTGRLRADIQTEIDKANPPRWGAWGTTVSYAIFMEYGTGRMGDPDVPHAASHWPPAGALDGWAASHGIPGGGRAVAAAIGRRGGLKPRRFMRGGLERTLPAIEGYLATLANEIEDAWRSR